MLYRPCMEHGRHCCAGCQYVCITADLSTRCSERQHSIVTMSALSKMFGVNIMKHKQKNYVEHFFFQFCCRINGKITQYPEADDSS